MCGICGKLDPNFLCVKCKNRLKMLAKFEVDNVDFNEENCYKHFYIFKYEGLIRKMILKYKFQEKSYLYKSIINFAIKDKKFFEFVEKYDTIVPVPISNKRYKERGYNQSYLLAKEIAKNTNLKLQNDCLLKEKNIVEQSKLNKQEREKNIQGVYKLQNSNKLKDKKLILLDDIFTTGSTAKECCKTLEEAHPKKIAIFTITKD